MMPFTDRRWNLFGPDNKPMGVDPSSLAEPMQADFDPKQDTPSSSSNDLRNMPFADRMRLIMSASEQGPAAKALQEHLNNAPVNKPSFSTSLASALSGAGAGWQNPAAGAKVAQEQLDAPFARKASEWEMKGKGLDYAAGLEDKGQKEKIGMFNQMVKDERQGKLDESTINKNNAQTQNYQSLMDLRKNEGWHFFEDKSTGEYKGVNPRTNETKNFGKIDLTPQQKEDLKINTFNTEEKTRQNNRVSMEGTRQTNRLNLFNTENKAITERQKNVHETNRKVDVNNPLPVRAPRDSYVSPQSQVAAIKQAAKELNIETGGKYKEFLNSDGSIKNPEDLGGMMSSGDSEGLKSFMQLVKDRATKIENKTRSGSESTATSTTPRVKPPVGQDPRIQQ